MIIMAANNLYASTTHHLLMVKAFPKNNKTFTFL